MIFNTKISQVRTSMLRSWRSKISNRVTFSIVLDSPSAGVPSCVELLEHAGSVAESIKCWYQFCCPRGKSLSSRIFEAQIYKSLSLSLDHKVLGNVFSRTSHSANSPLSVITKSTNSVIATMHEDTVENGLLTDVRYYYRYSLYE